MSEDLLDPQLVRLGLDAPFFFQEIDHTGGCFFPTNNVTVTFLLFRVHYCRVHIRARAQGSNSSKLLLVRFVERVSVNRSMLNVRRGQKQATYWRSTMSMFLLKW